MLKNKTDIYTNEKGQTLVIVFMMMVIALSIGLSVSSKYIKSLGILSRADNSARAHAVAEAAIEHLLLLPIATLEDYAQNGTCGANCSLTITSAEGQELTATVELSKLGNSSEPFLLDLEQTVSSQVDLMGYPDNTNINVCWNTEDLSVEAIFIHGTIGDYEADAMSYNPTTTTHGDNNFDLAAPLLGYSNCFTFNSQTDSAMLRLRSVYNDGPAVVIPSGGANLPVQGLLLESTGIAGSSQKKVSVIITDPVLPAIFDYAVYQRSTTDPLSN